MSDLFKWNKGKHLNIKHLTEHHWSIHISVKKSLHLKPITFFPKVSNMHRCSWLRSSRWEVFCKKGVIRNFTKFIGKHLCQSLFFNKVAGLACNYIEKETLAQVFSCEIWEISKNKFLQRTPLVAASHG